MGAVGGEGESGGVDTVRAHLGLSSFLGRQGSAFLRLGSSWWWGLRPRSLWQRRMRSTRQSPPARCCLVCGTPTTQEPLERWRKTFLDSTCVLFWHHSAFCQSNPAKCWSGLRLDSDLTGGLSGFCTKLNKGVQRYTQMGWLCADWGAATNADPSYNSTNYPDSNLVKNYCRNPFKDADRHKARFWKGRNIQGQRSSQLGLSRF